MVELRVRSILKEYFNKEGICRILVKSIQSFYWYQYIFSNIGIELNKTNRQNNFLIHFFKHVNIACTPVISRINHSHR